MSGDKIGDRDRFLFRGVKTSIRFAMIPERRSESLCAHSAVHSVTPDPEDVLDWLLVLSSRYVLGRSDDGGNTGDEERQKST